MHQQSLPGESICLTAQRFGHSDVVFLSSFSIEHRKVPPGNDEQ